MSNVTRFIECLDSVVQSPEFLNDSMMPLELAAKLPEWQMRIEEAGVVNWHSTASNQAVSLLRILSNPLRRQWSVQQLAEFTKGRVERIEKVLKLDKLDIRVDRNTIPVRRLCILTKIPSGLQLTFYDANKMKNDDAFAEAASAAAKQARQERRLLTES